MKKIVFFDTETNGILPTDSVLSISAVTLYYDEKNDVLLRGEEYNRFYYLNPGDVPNEKAISVNGLTEEEISLRRGEANYPKYFKDDVNSFYEFCNGANHFVAHNIKFDRQFIPFILKNQFDTMIENVEIVKIPGTSRGYKWPKLMECAKFYNIPLEEDRLHESLYDVIVTTRVFYVMHQKKHKKLLKFLNS